MSSSAVYKPKTKFMKGFRIGYDMIPRWFVSYLRNSGINMNTVKIVKGKGLYLGDIFVQEGFYLIYDKESDELKYYPEDIFKELFEVQELLNKSEMYQFRYHDNFEEIS